MEIDQPATSAVKARGVALEGPPENMIQIPADLGENALSKVLSQEGPWDCERLSTVVAEGLFQYLSDSEVRALLRETAACTPPGSRLVFTHAIPGQRRMVSLLTRLIGEPWRSGVRSENLPDYVHGTGWKIVSEPDTDPAHGVERYAVAERW